LRVTKHEKNNILLFTNHTKIRDSELTTIVSSGRLKEVGESDGKSYEVVM